jgi:hypothetical protein
LFRAGVEATVMPLGKVSLTAIPIIAPEFVAGLVMVRVRVEVPLTGTLPGLKDFVIVGAAVTIKAAVFEATPVPPFVEVGAFVVLL